MRLEVARNESPVRWLTDEQYSDAPGSERALAWAASQVGVRERGRNRGPEVEQYQEYAGLGTGGGFAWCACFVYWCGWKAGLRTTSLPASGNAASVLRWRQWAVLNKRRQAVPKRGRLFYWLDGAHGHIGFCRSSSVLGVFGTIEGNTNGGGSRDGDGVYARFRTMAELKRHKEWGFIDL